MVTSCIQLEARKVSNPVLFIRPDSEDAIFIHDIVASLNFLPEAVLILFQCGDRSGPWIRRIKKRDSCTSVLIAAGYPLCLSQLE